MTTKKPLIKKIAAGGTLSTLLLGLILEGHAQYKDLRGVISTNETKIAVIETVDKFQIEINRRMIKDLDIIKADIKQLLRSRHD